MYQVILSGSAPPQPMTMKKLFGRYQNSHRTPYHPDTVQAINEDAKGDYAAFLGLIMNCKDEGRRYRRYRQKHPSLHA
jgi:hypothetical protein